MENIYHRYINLPFEIARPDNTHEYPNIVQHVDMRDHVDQNMLDFHHSIGLEIQYMELFYTPPNQVLPIHSDLPVLDNRTKINITWGPDEGRTRWWKAKSPDLMKVTGLSDYGDDFSGEDHHRNLTAAEEDCDMVWEANTNKPSLVNVGQLHSTYNPGEYGRWTLCFCIGEQVGSRDMKTTFLNWENALDKYKDYIGD